MIVEDEIIQAMDLKSDLIGMGYEVCELVTTGEDAINNVEQEKPDIVLMDIILNGKINGIGAAKKIHSLYGIPIIFITGHDDEGRRELADKVEPSGYFIKPLDIEGLKLAIEKALHTNMN